MPSSRSRRGDRHGWNTWHHYVSIHNRRIDDSSPFVEHDGLTYVSVPELVRWTGRIRCQGGIEITVLKVQERRVQSNGRVQVRTIRYSYHATRTLGDRAIDLLRYDNVHAHPGHEDAHHRHVFDSKGNEVDIRWIGRDGWPLLSEVIEEVRRL